MSRNWQQLKVTIGLVSDRFGSQTDVTAFDIGFDIVPESRSVILPSDKFSSLLNAKVAG